MTTVKIERAFIHLRSHLFIMLFGVKPSKFHKYRAIDSKSNCRLFNCLQIWKPVVCNIQQLCMINFLPKHEQFSRVSIYKNIFLIHVLKEQIGDINFISFVIASGEATTFTSYYSSMNLNKQCIGTMPWIR